MQIVQLLERRQRTKMQEKQGMPKMSRLLEKHRKQILQKKAKNAWNARNAKSDNDPKMRGKPKVHRTQKVAEMQKRKEFKT